MKSTDRDTRTEELLEEYKYLVRDKARLYFMLGGDMEDLIQEGMIGLYKAIQSYDAGKGASFKTFADICINRQIINAIKNADTKKHSPLNNAESIDSPLGRGEEYFSLGDTIAAGSDTDPETLMLLSEMTELILSPKSKLLSANEREVFIRLLQGKDYKSIAKELGKTPKQTDNSIQRIRGKLKRFFSE